MKHAAGAMQLLTGHLDGATTDPHPEITCYPAEGIATGIGLVILAGGGYHRRAEHEGRGYAEHLSRRGVACFEVAYRTPGSGDPRHPAPLEDALAAIATVRARAGDYGVDPGRMGIVGSSAGGHCAALALVAWSDYGGCELRPDFGVLCYPVILVTGTHSHRGSIDNLLGPDPSPERLAEVDVTARVAITTPPCFLWHTGEDAVVPLENSLAFAAALRSQGVPFELHCYAAGGHGMGLNATFPWAEDCLRWLGSTAADAPQ